MCLIGGRRHQVIVHGTDPLIQELEDLQVVYGQGPCIEAVETGSPVLVDDLASYRTPTWQTYADQALARGVRAVFAFPIATSTAQLGALDLYRLLPGPLTAEQIQDATVLTHIAARAMLAQKDRDTVDGSVSALSWLTAAQRSPSGPPGETVTRGRAVDLGLPPRPGHHPRRLRPPLAHRPTPPPDLEHVSQPAHRGADIGSWKRGQRCGRGVYFSRIWWARPQVRWVSAGWWVSCGVQVTAVPLPVRFA